MVAIGAAVAWPPPEVPEGATPTVPLTVETTTTTTDPLAEATLGSAGPDTPTPARPATVLLVGDSEAGGLAPFLKSVLAPIGVTTVTVADKVSSGLARPDFFDWPRRLGALMTEVAPDIVVVMIGGNDAQPLLAADGSLIARLDLASPEAWQAEYRLRIDELIDLASIGQTRVIWVGIPNARGAEFNRKLTVLDATVRDALRERPAVTFVDARRRFATRSGKWTKSIVDPADGRRKVVRASDGFHLNPAGATILAHDVGIAVVNELRIRGADVTLGSSPSAPSGS